QAKTERPEERRARRLLRERSFRRARSLRERDAAGIRLDAEDATDRQLDRGRATAAGAELFLLGTADRVRGSGRGVEARLFGRRGGRPREEGKGHEAGCSLHE